MKGIKNTIFIIFVSINILIAFFTLNYALEKKTNEDKLKNEINVLKQDIENKNITIEEQETKIKKEHEKEIKEMEKPKLNIYLLAEQRVQINQVYKNYRISYIYHDKNSLYNQEAFALIIYKDNVKVVEILEYSEIALINAVKLLNEEFDFIK